jgi:hypothetical protein
MIYAVFIPLFSAAAGALIATSAQHCFARKRECQRDAEGRKQAAREQFHDVMAQRIARIEFIEKSARPDHTLLTLAAEDIFMQESIPMLGLAVHLASRHIRPEDWQALQIALADFEAYQTKYKGETGRCLLANQNQPKLADTVLAKLKKIDACVSSNPVR